MLPTRREATESQAARDQADRDSAEWHGKQKEHSDEAPAVPLPAPVPTPPAPAAAPREPRRTNAEVRGVDMTPFWKTITLARERKRDGRSRIDTPDDQEMVDLGEHPPMPWSRPPDAPVPVPPAAGLEVELIVLGPAPAEQPAPPVEAEVDPPSPGMVFLPLLSIDDDDLCERMDAWIQTAETNGTPGEGSREWEQHIQEMALLFPDPVIDEEDDPALRVRWPVPTASSPSYPERASFPPERASTTKSLLLSAIFPR